MYVMNIKTNCKHIVESVAIKLIATDSKIRDLTVK